MGRCKLDAKWRITVPKDLREGFKPGDEFIVERIGDRLIIRPAGRDALAREFENIVIRVRPEHASKNAEAGKHRFGGVKV